MDARATRQVGRAWPPLPGGPACLFLDVDGTLVDFALRPEGVAVDAGLIELLRAASKRTHGAMALVSGRPIAQLDRLFAPLNLPAAGVHGDERRDADGAMHYISDEDERLRPARATLRALVSARAGLIFEDKRSALALHYRLSPQFKEEAHETMTQLAQGLLPDYELLDGNHVFELKPRSFNKAMAIEAFLAESPFRGRTPVFLGDDTTDMDGFAAVERHGGLAIAVGERVSATWRLADPLAVRAWLQAFTQSGNAGS
ncbi:MAG: trehalose-phosphatase [Steroidobacteraceae bacterium]